MSKYGNKKAIVDGIRFDSLLEAQRYSVLIGRLDRGEISDLRLQPHITLVEGWKEITGEIVKPLVYIADFSYCVGGRKVYEDVKGVKTEAYKIKRKLVRDKTGISIVEITRDTIDS